jgi:hypothetical protein
VGYPRLTEDLMNNKTMLRIAGKMYTLVHDFGMGRAIVDFDGAFVLVDALPNGDWELSGEPAREDEKPALNKLVATMGTTTTVTEPDGDTKTYKDD